MRSAGLSIVWFKRDLRVADHAPLHEAAARGPVLPLYIVEPAYWMEPDASGRQWAFLRECLVELRSALAALGQPLIVRVGDAIEVLEALAAAQPIKALFSHEETGNGWTYTRDRRVAAWAAAAGIPWQEVPQHGVVRRLRRREGWAQRWERFMHRPLLDPPLRLPALELSEGVIPHWPTAGLSPDPCPGRQPGGRHAGMALLAGFLAVRGKLYQRAMSAPEPAALHCSRLSAHLSLGTVSLRETLQAAEAARASWADHAEASTARQWRSSLGSFISRLHWHCHFIQKLESEPELEFREVHPAFEGARADHPERLAAWAQGRTGWPFQDACMRALDATGWLNFRMRAMVMAVASYHLWLPWRETGLELARRFTDYEPGIHWSQAQMQSGTTGINSLRIYNPVKQGHDHDPQGRFIRRWVPELATLPTAFAHEPWRMPEPMQRALGCVIGRDYPAPLVDQREALREARQRMTALRRSESFAPLADAVQERHGSRGSGLRQPSAARATVQAAEARQRLSRQLDLGL